MIQNIFALARLDVNNVFVRCLQTQEVLKYDGFSVLLFRSFFLQSAFGSRVYTGGPDVEYDYNNIAAVYKLRKLL